MASAHVVDSTRLQVQALHQLGCGSGGALAPGRLRGWEVVAAMGVHDLEKAWKVISVHPPRKVQHLGLADYSVPPLGAALAHHGSDQSSEEGATQVQVQGQEGRPGFDWSGGLEVFQCVSLSVAAACGAPFIRLTSPSSHRRPGPRENGEEGMASVGRGSCGASGGAAAGEGEGPISLLST